MSDKTFSPITFNFILMSLKYVTQIMNIIIVFCVSRFLYTYVLYIAFLYQNRFNVFKLIVINLIWNVGC